MTTRRGESPLQRLDARVLPRAAARLQRAVVTVRGWASPRTAVGGAAGSVLRRQPALAASIASVLIASVLVAVAGGDNKTSSAPAVRPTPPVSVASLGPVPGSSVSDYLRNASFDLRHFGEIAQGRSTYAVVDLRAYQTPAQAATTFAGVDVARVYVRVPAARLPTQVHAVAVHGISDIPAELQTTAAVASATAKSYAVLVAGLHPKSAVDRQVKARYARQQQAAAAESKALARPDRCACVFSAVVHADAAHLAALLRIAAVRVVDPAPPTVTLEALSVFPLEPEITTVVPKTGLIGG